MVPTTPTGSQRCVRVLTVSAVAALATLFSPSTARAQDPAGVDTTVYTIDPVVVTATRSPRAVTNIPRPVSVIQRRDLVELTPNTVSDLFRSLPGLDVTGVGVSQVRPQIRGQGGQRILLLNDGLRMNNTRRQKDFGELPALVDVNAVQQVEVVRGPASVLYGSDAIAGVVNIITEAPTQEGFRGSLSYLGGLYGSDPNGSVAGQHRVSGRVSGRNGAVSLQAGGSWRDASSFWAPSGSFGDVTLADDVRVANSGVEDLSLDARLGYDFTESVSAFAKVERYGADDSGFGYVNPAAYAAGEPEIEITYPKQRFNKVSAGVRARDLDNGVADGIDLTVYGQDNERELVFDAFIPFFPGAGVALDNQNFTDIRTYGFRAEARKLLDSSGLLITYGADGFRDRSVGSDNNTSVTTGFGPPIVDMTTTPSLPDAEFLSLGAFVQGEIDVGERLSLVAGGRYQDVTAETFATASLGNSPVEESNSTGVWAVNAMFELVQGLDLVGSTGRGFRSPNLVELFFDGAVPEGSAYQRAATGLKAETSFNFDIGARYQIDELFLEGFFFRNKVSDGIRSRVVLDAGGMPVQTQGLDTFENVNIDEIVLKGIELNADVRLVSGIELGSTFSTLDAEDAVDPDNPVGESYSTKWTGRAGYRDPGGLFWGQYEVRYSGEQKEVALGTSNPLGAVLPSFTTMAVRAGVRLPEFNGLTNSLTLTVANLMDELYAETANGSFFRPEPGRNLSLMWNVVF